MRQRVLIMEDDVDLLNQWEYAFEAVSIEIVRCASRTEAESLLNYEHFDALVTDLFIRTDGGIDQLQGGILLIGHVRNAALGFTPEWAQAMPIVAVTASQAAPVSTMSTFDPLSFAADGADRTMRKPFRPQELVVQVVDLLNQAAERDAEETP